MASILARALRLSFRQAKANRLEVKAFKVRSCHGQAQDKKNVLQVYLQKVLDNPLPIGAGALVVGLLQWKRIRERNEAQSTTEGHEIKVLSDDDWQVAAYKTLPLRHVSRLWGFVNDIYLPVWTRTKILGLYARTFGCDLSEAEVDTLEHYENLGEFFRRRLKASARPISEKELISPCDGKVLHFGPIDVQNGLVEQVKGVTYSLSAFLGSYFSSSPHTLALTANKLTKDEVPKTLYQVVFYLAPGDYHCFHSPVDWSVHQRRHFPGELLSVSPSVVSKVERVFELNERAVYLGEWKHGFFSMAAVGATNVGSIKVGMDPELSTNRWKWESKTFHQKEFKESIHQKKGELFGEFNLGSTIVLIFEAPHDFDFDLYPFKPVKVGIPIQAEK